MELNKPKEYINKHVSKFIDACIKKCAITKTRSVHQREPLLLYKHNGKIYLMYYPASKELFVKEDFLLYTKTKHTISLETFGPTVRETFTQHIKIDYKLHCFVENENM